MLINSILLIFLLIFSFFLFFINNLFLLVILLFLSIILSVIFKVRLPLYLPFIIVIIINFFLNYFISGINDAFIVSIRLFIMFIAVNLIISIIGISNISKIIGNVFRSKELALIISISLCFIPLMIKEIRDIKTSLYAKNFSLNFKNIITKGHVFVICFFTNLFKRVDDMEKYLLSCGMED